MHDLSVRMVRSIPKRSVELCLHALLLLQLSQTESRDVYSHKGSTAEWIEVGANQWHSFDSWGQNSPAGRQYAAATAILGNNIGKSREMMLLYGGKTSDFDNRTWIYDLESNSWEATRRVSGPPAIIHHTLVTLCQRQVLLFGGFPYSLETRNKQCSNETWLFDMAQKEWRLLETVIHPKSRNSYVTPRCQHTATVVRFENSLCTCKEAMFVYSGLPSSDATWSSNVYRGLGDSWLLTCKDDRSRLYEWIRLDPGNPELSHPGAVSAFNNTIVYLFGATPPFMSTRGRDWEVWSYHLSTRTWKKRNNSTSQESPPGQGIYVSSDNQSYPYHFLLSCCFQPLTVYDMVQERWFRPQQTGNTRSLSKDSCTIANVGGRILFFCSSYFIFFSNSPSAM